MNISAPREDVSSHVDASRAEAGQPASQDKRKRLARNLRIARTWGFASMVVCVVALPINLNSLGAVVFGLFIVLGIALLGSVAEDYRKTLDSAAGLIDTQQKTISQLEIQNTDLLIEKFRLLRLRGNTDQAANKESGGVEKVAAAGLTSERYESAAVVHEFPNPKGAGA
jgi:hypothetical protein